MKESWFARYGTWLYRGMGALAFVSILWLNQNYVTRADFRESMNERKLQIEQFSAKIDQLTTVLNNINTTMAVVVRQQDINTKAIEVLWKQP